MQTPVRSIVLLAGACLLAALCASAQVTQPPMKRSTTSLDVAFTYSPERAQIVPGNCCFWLQGAAVDAALTTPSGLGIAANLSGEHTSNVLPGVDINKVTYLLGPRFTRAVWSGQSRGSDKRRLQLFGEALVGGVHGFNGIYPAPGASTTSATAFAFQAGGGVNFYLSHHFGLRLAEADYVRTTLPNNSSDIQDDLRLAFGVTVHFW